MTEKCNGLEKYEEFKEEFRERSVVGEKLLDIIDTIYPERMIDDLAGFVLDIGEDCHDSKSPEANLPNQSPDSSSPKR